MKIIGKYNLFKAISSALTVGTPLTVIGLCSDFIVHDSSASISVVGVIGILLAALFLKDKIAENFKIPSAFVLATVLFVLIIFIESILVPVKYACLATMIMSGIDELSFKRIYKRLELQMPEKAKAYKYLGFLICTTKTLEV